MQVVHKEQYDDKRQVLQEATTVDDMYDMLAVYEQKVVTADQVSHHLLSKYSPSQAAANSMSQIFD